MSTAEVLARRLLASRYAARGNAAAHAHLALSETYLHRISVQIARAAVGSQREAA